jgi:hypothetical protein
MAAYQLRSLIAAIPQLRMRVALLNGRTHTIIKDDGRYRL